MAKTEKVIKTGKELLSILENLTESEILFTVEKQGKCYILPSTFLKYIAEDYLFKKNLKNPKGEILIKDDTIAIAGTTTNYGEWFETKGYTKLFIKILNPTWTTNPTSMTLFVQFTDNNGTTAYTLSQHTSALSVSLIVSDAYKFCIFIPIGISNVGDIGNTDAFQFGSLPNIDSDMKMRIAITPAGSAESQDVTYTVYGVE